MKLYVAYYKKHNATHVDVRSEIFDGVKAPKTEKELERIQGWLPRHAVITGVIELEG
jgi:hypothetical protein